MSRWVGWVGFALLCIALAMFVGGLWWWALLGMTSEVGGAVQGTTVVCVRVGVVLVGVVLLVGSEDES